MSANFFSFFWSQKNVKEKEQLLFENKVFGLMKGGKQNRDDAVFVCIYLVVIKKELLLWLLFFESGCKDKGHYKYDPNF